MKNPIRETVAIFPVISIFLQRALNRDPVSNSLRHRLSSSDRSKDLFERIGASCRLISSPGPKSRDPSYPEISGCILSRRECAKLQRHSYLPERGGQSRSLNTVSSAWRVAFQKLDKQKTGTSWDTLSPNRMYFAASRSLSEVAGRFGSAMGN